MAVAKVAVECSSADEEQPSGEADEGALQVGSHADHHHPQQQQQRQGTLVIITADGETNQQQHGEGIEAVRGGRDFDTMIHRMKQRNADADGRGSEDGLPSPRLRRKGIISTQRNLFTTTSNDIDCQARDNQAKLRDLVINIDDAQQRADNEVDFIDELAILDAHHPAAMSYLQVPNGNYQLDVDARLESSGDSGVASLDPNDMENRSRGVQSTCSQPFDRHPERRKQHRKVSSFDLSRPQVRRTYTDRSFTSGCDETEQQRHRRSMQKRSLQATRSAPVSPAPSQAASPRFRKKSLLDRLGGSVVSERGMRFAKKLYRSVSHPMSFGDGEGSREIGFPGKSKRSKGLQKYRVVEAKSAQKDGISFEVIGKSEHFLRSQGNTLTPEKDGGDTYFNKDCTFVPLQDMWFPGYFAFESASKPSYFIRLADEDQLRLDKFDGTEAFKEECSFVMKKRPCATCLQVGVRSWAKLSNGEYTLGRVTSIGDIVEVTIDDGKKLHYNRISICNQLIPDVIPLQSDLPLGTRVLAQWLSRETLYPGVITGVHGDEYDVEYDDGDRSREKAFQIRLLRSYSFRENLECSDERLSDEGNSQQTEPYYRSDSHPSTCHHSNHSGSPMREIILRENSQPVSAQVLRQHRPPLTRSLAVRHSPESDRSSNNNHNGIAPSTIPSTNANETIESSIHLSPAELETLSQDSGYHGYQKMLERGQYFNRRQVSVPMEGMASSAVKKYSFDLRGSSRSRSADNRHERTPTHLSRDCQESPETTL